MDKNMNSQFSMIKGGLDKVGFNLPSWILIGSRYNLLWVLWKTTLVSVQYQHKNQNDMYIFSKSY